MTVVFDFGTQESLTNGIFYQLFHLILNSNYLLSAVKWEDPDDSVVYCIASDHFITILSGTARYGLTRLWDKRYSKNSIQMYYVGKGYESNNSPVYSLCFDGLFAYIALDSSINLLSFDLK